jgi:hypothetical protein
LSQTLEENEVDSHRFENCKHYESCLDIAANGRWVSFSCMGCERFEHNPDFTIVTEIKKEAPTMPPKPGNLRGVVTEFSQLLTSRMRAHKIAHFNNLGWFVKG